MRCLKQAANTCASECGRRQVAWSEDELVKPEGLLSYIVPPPSLLQPLPSDPDHEDSTSTSCSAGSDENEESGPDPPEDSMEDRNYDNPPVRKTVTALYENGWFSGTILYFKKVLKAIKQLTFSPTKILIV